MWTWLAEVVDALRARPRFVLEHRAGLWRCALLKKTRLGHRLLPVGPEFEDPAEAAHFLEEIETCAKRPRRPAPSAS